MSAAPGADAVPEGGAAPALHIDGPRATLTLRRPRHRNRLQRSDLATLQHACAEIGERVARGEPLRVLVLTGLGETFCAGFHLGEIAESPQAAADDPLAFERAVQAIEDQPLPSIARLNGGVFGGGTDLALACDFRVAEPACVLRMPAAQLGLHYYASGLRRAVAKLGLATARRLFLLGQTLDAAALLEAGWLDVLAGPGALDAEVDHLAAALCAGAPLAVRGMRASLVAIARGEQDDTVLRAREAACAASDDLREGLAAAHERRPPRFKGS
jgi:enoyl-CoA hydratase